MIDLSKFNNRFFKELNLSSNQLLLDNNKYLFSIREVGEAKTAMRYYEKAQGSESPIKKLKANSPKYFLISSKNFPLFSIWQTSTYTKSAILTKINSFFQ